MLTVFLYPPDLSEAEEHQRRFQRNRVGYYSAFIAMCVLDIAQTAIHGDLLHPIWYVPFIGHYAVLAAIGLFAHRRGYDRFFAWYQLITLLVWALVVRRYLVGEAMPLDWESRSPGIAMLYSALNRYPFIPRAGICEHLHDAH